MWRGRVGERREMRRREGGGVDWVRGVGGGLLEGETRVK